MLGNWSLEALKWRYLIRKTERISFWTAFRAVLAGITVSTFTPNRVGEYFGRVFLLKETNPWKGAFMTMVGSISQLLITVWIGSIAIIIFAYQYIPYQDYIPGFLFWCIVAAILLIDLMLVLFYFNIRLLEPLLRRFTLKRWEKLREHLKVFGAYTSRELFFVLLFSMGRYLIFSLQFIFLFRIFMVPVGILDGFMLVACIYLFMSAVPTIALSEMGVRGSLAVFFFGIFYADRYLLQDAVDTGTVMASFMVWIINLVIPAIIGGFFVLQLKFFRK
jgi:uncharacterized membrane protein YbhN (UPF0104 family)